jgi:hypothetical protein
VSEAKIPVLNRKNSFGVVLHSGKASQLHGLRGLLWLLGVRGGDQNARRYDEEEKWDHLRRRGHATS